MAPPYQPQQAQPMSMPRHNIPEDFSTTYGLNPLVNAASTLLAVFSKTRESLSHPNVGGLHQQLDREIKEFDIKARNAGVKEDTVMVARYLLCTILDEAVLNTPWGAESAWNQRTLLGIFHKETAGGEKFFAILDRLRNNPSENIDVLELIYICLSLGYEGKYRVVARGRDQLEQLRDDLFYIIRSYRGEYERSLSPCWQGLANSRNTLLNYVPMWVVASVVVGLMALTYSGFRYWLDQSSASTSQQLIEIKNENSPIAKDIPKSNVQ
ncbi:DotU family type IV/VI secretion system protein [Colwellia echini]|uniref:DotU family type IV/VI secretion system protein n=2 Tax=Colwellia echini TaxID=1982103 RepID=A0ABY3MWD4_9GAMM|nr:DotU family type IV/VI secretion system protein [Colwellia echini]